jgi:ribosome maturation factor RimP
MRLTKPGEMRLAHPELDALLRATVEAMGYELVGVELVQPGSGTAVLRILIDHVDGITLGDCEAVSRQISGLLDVEDPISGHYDLEVSSPGLDRPLFTGEQLQRFTGERARVRLDAKLDGRRRFDGVLRGVDAGRLYIEADGEVFALPLEMIDSARLVPEF